MTGTPEPSPATSKGVHYHEADTQTASGPERRHSEGRCWHPNWSLATRPNATPVLTFLSLLRLYTNELFLLMLMSVAPISPSYQLLLRRKGVDKFKVCVFLLTDWDFFFNPEGGV